MVKPKTEADYLQLLEEALRLVGELNESIDKVFFPKG